jgi:F-type H+-transporting ATPase subunit alpha
LDKATQAQLGRGQRMQEILKQPQYEPMSLENQVTVLFAGTNGYADQVPVEKMRQWELDLVRYMTTTYPEIGKSITAENKITDDNRVLLTRALEAFKVSWQG